MKTLKTKLLSAAAALVTSLGAFAATESDVSIYEPSTDISNHGVIVGAQRPNLYVKELAGKRVALMSNQSGLVAKDKHTLDLMLEKGVNVVRIYSPEHGFRGVADAGEHVSSSVDEKTGVPIMSLYGAKEKSSFEGIDVIVIDIQDVGLRYYTYYVTMVRLMNVAIENDLEFMVLDRPNPNGMYVDGPILDMQYKSGVGGLPITVVHGMTLGEIARMAQGEGWLKDGKKVKKLTVVPCKHYTHQTRYQLPVAPSPNLPNMTSVYLYPSICYFEATPVSLGRGTEIPFQCYGHPDMTGYDFEFTPIGRFGAKNPPQKDKLCHGVDLSKKDHEQIISEGINLNYLLDAYHNLNMGDKFFRKFFELLIGDGNIRMMIEGGATAEQIKATWADDVEKFKQQRKPYLLYKE